MPTTFMNALTDRLLLCVTVGYVAYIFTLRRYLEWVIFTVQLHKLHKCM